MRGAGAISCCFICKRGTSLNKLIIIALAGFTTGITTVLYGFGGGFVVMPFVYQLLVRQLAGNAMHIAVATSTAVMILNADWISYQNWRAAGFLHPS